MTATLEWSWPQNGTKERGKKKKKKQKCVNLSFQDITQKANKVKKNTNIAKNDGRRLKSGI